MPREGSPPVRVASRVSAGGELLPALPVLGGFRDPALPDRRRRRRPAQSGPTPTSLTAAALRTKREHVASPRPLRSRVPRCRLGAVRRLLVRVLGSGPHRQHHTRRAGADTLVAVVDHGYL